MPPYNNPKKQHKKNSIAWQYFTPEGDTASCKVCGRTYKYTNGGTSMLLRHVKYHQAEGNGADSNSVGAQNMNIPQNGTQLTANQTSPSVSNSTLLLPTSRQAQPEQANPTVVNLTSWNMESQQKQPSQVSISPKTNLNNQAPEIQQPVAQTDFSAIPDPSLLQQKDTMDNRAQPILPPAGHSQEQINMAFSGPGQNSTSYYQPPVQPIEATNVPEEAAPIKQQQQQQQQQSQPLAEQRFQPTMYQVPSNITQVHQVLPQLSPQNLTNTPIDYPQTQFEHDIVDLFLNNNIPYTIIESPEFIKIFKKLVPYKLYSARLLKLIVITKIHLQGNQILENLTHNNSHPSNMPKNQDHQL